MNCDVSDRLRADLGALERERIYKTVNYGRGERVPRVSMISQSDPGTYSHDRRTG
jgi:hypothetical protein